MSKELLVPEPAATTAVGSGIEIYDFQDGTTYVALTKSLVRIYEPTEDGTVKVPTPMAGRYPFTQRVKNTGIALYVETGDFPAQPQVATDENIETIANPQEYALWLPVTETHDSGESVLTRYKFPDGHTYSTIDFPGDTPIETMVKKTNAGETVVPNPRNAYLEASYPYSHRRALGALVVFEENGFWPDRELPVIPLPTAC